MCSGRDLKKDAFLDEKIEKQLLQDLEQGRVEN